MAGRGRIAPHIFQVHDAQPPLLGPPLHVVHILDETLQDRLVVHHRKIHDLLADNQHVVATHAALKQELNASHNKLVTHVALKQELDASHNELVVAENIAARARAERDVEVREVLERSVKAEA
ncbi:hypothetical protein KSP39_PZI008404 [Platanthera zijinensis]|uniref:Uncharacterized protein n=1 Tax=Platanthera zijinensis TaxID=2320716 RepID=A0AAP0BP47_9ASPA